MREMWLTLQERQLIWLLRWWVGVFLATAIVFAFFPAELIYWMNIVGKTIFHWHHEWLPPPTEHFWQVLSVSLLIVLTYVAFEAQRDIRQNFSFVKIIILSKIVTTLGFLCAFIFDGVYFVYLSGMIIDLSVLLLTWFCYSRSSASRAL